MIILTMINFLQRIGVTCDKIVMTPTLPLSYSNSASRQCKDYTNNYADLLIIFIHITNLTDIPLYQKL